MKNTIFLLIIILTSCQKSETKAHFITQDLENGFVKTTVKPDGNTWTTTKDSVQIYIDNY